MNDLVLGQEGAAQSYQTAQRIARGTVSSLLAVYNNNNNTKIYNAHM